MKANSFVVIVLIWLIIPMGFNHVKNHSMINVYLRHIISINTLALRFPPQAPLRSLLTPSGPPRSPNVSLLPP